MTSSADGKDRPITSQSVDDNDLEVGKCLVGRNTNQSLLKFKPLSDFQYNSCNNNKTDNKTVCDYRSSNSKLHSVENGQIYEEIQSKFPDNLKVEHCLFHGKTSQGDQNNSRQKPLSEIRYNSCINNKRDNITFFEHTSSNSKFEKIENEQIYEEIQSNYVDNEIML